MSELQSVGDVVALSRRDLDLADLATIGPVLRALRPTVVLNAAAYTAVDRAESDAPLARRVNGDAPGVIGEVARALGAAVVHFSTDYLFDGRRGTPYREGDTPSPLNVYRHTKLAGERALEASGAAHLTARTSWVYAMHGHNSVRTMLRLATERDSLRVVSDQHGTPTWARWLAGALAHRCRPAHARTRRDGGGFPSGWRPSASDRIGRHELACLRGIHPGGRSSFRRASGDIGRGDHHRRVSDACSTSRPLGAGQLARRGTAWCPEKAVAGVASPCARRAEPAMTTQRRSAVHFILVVEDM